MAVSLSNRILDHLPSADSAYYKLVLVVGPARSCKTAALNDLAVAMSCSRINVNLQLSERLLDLTQIQRAVRIAGLIDDIVRASTADVALLDNIEMLFAIELAQDPLRLLQTLSRHRTVVVAWPGTYDGNTLTYAEPGHPESRKYASPQAVIVNACAAISAGVVSSQEETS